MFGQVGTLLIVTFVTLLVWLYAEDANIQEYNEQAVRLQFVAPPSSGGQITPAEPITVLVDFDGSNGQYQQFLAATRGGVIPIELSFDPDKELDTVSVDISDQLERNVLRDLGINLTGVSRDVQMVTFEKIIDVQVPIEIEVSEAMELAEPPRLFNADLRYVEIKGVPAGRRPELEGVKASVELEPKDIAAIPRGGEGQLDMPVVLSPRVEGLTPSPPRVTVLVKRADNQATVTIDRRPVLLSNASSINERYVVQIDEADRFITAFELKGPRAVIQQLSADPNTSAVWAAVRLTNEEADEAAANGGELSKQVEIIAPDGVVLNSDVVRVTVRVTPRAATPSP